MKKIAVFLAVLLLLAAPVLAAEPTEALSDVLGADELTQSLPDEAAEVLDGLSPDGTPDFRSGVRSHPARGGRRERRRAAQRPSPVRGAAGHGYAVRRRAHERAEGPCERRLGRRSAGHLCGLPWRDAVHDLAGLGDGHASFGLQRLPAAGHGVRHGHERGTVSAGALYAGTALFSGLLSRLIARLLLPGVSVYLVVAAAEAALADSLLSELREFVGWLISKSLRVVLFVFTGYLTVTGVISGSADAAAVRATKAAVSGMVPVVGSILFDASETLLASASALKSSMGVFGMLAVLAICLAPFLKIGAQYLLLKGTAAVSGTIGMPQQVKLVKHAATAMGYLLAMTGACALMLLISVVCFLKVVG